MVNNRLKGRAFENKVRKDLESQGYIVDKWSNNIDNKTGELKQAKPFKTNTGFMMMTGGFPDFIAFKPYEARIGVEVKINGWLSMEERKKCLILLEKGVFPDLLIAREVQEGMKKIIKYEEFYNYYKEWVEKNAQRRD